jgi:hypothetical protein
MPRECLLLAHRVNSRQRSKSVAFGAKRTFSEPRLQSRIYEYARLVARTFICVPSIERQLGGESPLSSLMAAKD